MDFGGNFSSLGLPASLKLLHSLDYPRKANRSLNIDSKVVVEWITFLSGVSE